MKNTISRLRTAVRATFTAALCMGICSCSFLAPRTQRVVVRSSDAGAAIRVNGQYVGKGAVAVNLPTDQAHLITAQGSNKHGATVLDKHFSVTGVLDIIGGCCFIVPIAGLFSKGAWELDRDTVFIDMR